MDVKYACFIDERHHTKTKNAAWTFQESGAVSNGRETAERRIMPIGLQYGTNAYFYMRQKTTGNKAVETNQMKAGGVVNEGGCSRKFSDELESKKSLLNENIQSKSTQRLKCPYSSMAKDGIIEYNGVIFNCDYKHNAITLGDMSDKKKVMNISLPSGGSLKVNVDNIGSLSKAAGMFTPEDLNAVMRAIHQYNHLTYKLYEIEEEEDETAEKVFEAEEVSYVRDVSEIKAVSLKDMLKEKYPNLVYHVGDGSNSYWRTRNDFPFEYLFRESEESGKMLENWKPNGENPTYQRYIAAAPGSKAVMIHPKAQERLENDPEFAKEVMDRIEAWWNYDIARNEAIAPGYTAGMSQAIAIGEDGEITNVLSCGGGDSFIRRSNGKKGNGQEEEYDWWAERHARHIMYMRLWLTGQADFGGLSSVLGGGGFEGGNFGGLFGNGAAMGGFLDSQLAQAAENEIHDMIENGNLKEILGDTICGDSTEAVLAHTWSEIEQGRKLRNALSGYASI